MPQGAGTAAGPGYRFSNDKVSAHGYGRDGAASRGYWECATGAGVPASGQRSRVCRISACGAGPAVGGLLWPRATTRRRRRRRRIALKQTIVSVPRQAYHPVDWFQLVRRVRHETAQRRSRQGHRDFRRSRKSLTTGQCARAVGDSRLSSAPACGSTLDLTDRPARPDVRRAVHVHLRRLPDRDFDRYSFKQWSVDLRQHIPIVAGARTIVLRAVRDRRHAERRSGSAVLLPADVGRRVHAARIWPIPVCATGTSFASGGVPVRAQRVHDGCVFYDAGKVGHRKQRYELRRPAVRLGLRRALRVHVRTCPCAPSRVRARRDRGSSSSSAMSSSLSHRRLAAVAVALPHGRRSGWAAAQRFYPDDPLWLDDDRAFDATKARKRPSSARAMTFVMKSFGEARRSPRHSRPEHEHTRRGAGLELVHESDRPAADALDEIRTGPDTFEHFDVTDWVIVRDKGAPGFQPGFRAVRCARQARRRAQLYQLEGDTEDYPELASGVGNDWHVLLPRHRLQRGGHLHRQCGSEANHDCAESATLRDASGRRPFKQATTSTGSSGCWREESGRHLSHDGEPVRGGKAARILHYFGTRPDDPNDIYPHEHRRELRANRVFCAWLNHDDSRAHQHARHARRRAKAASGSSTTCSTSARCSAARRAAGRASGTCTKAPPRGRRWLTFGFWMQPWQLHQIPVRSAGVGGPRRGDAFEPEKWKPEYPNPAFDNMRPDDAFWAARIVAAFSDEAIAAIVRKAKYSDPKRDRLPDRRVDQTPRQDRQGLAERRQSGRGL